MNATTPAKAGFESGLRAALRTAIVARDEAERRVGDARRACDRWEDEVFAARSRLNEVRAQAGERVSERVAALVAGGDALVMDRDRFAERDAEETVTACRAARDLVRAELREAESALDLAERRVRDAVGAVMAGAGEHLVKACEAAKREFAERAAILRFIRSNLSDGLRRRADEATSFPANFERCDHPALQPWKACAASLSRDPDAKFPE